MSRPVEERAVEERPVQRVGHIGDDDNRFCGHAVFAELATSVRSPAELWALACGVDQMSDDDHEVWRVMALALTSPDARVWPLKLARTLASYGNPVAGCFGAQLGNDSDRMGPGTATGAARSLAWIAEQAGEGADDATVASVVARHLAERGRIAGFGVPLRPEDERLVGLRRLLAGHSATAGRHWRLHEQVVTAVRAASGLAPNIVIGLAALLLDLGLRPARAGMAVSLLMAHTFAAHAIEAAEEDGPRLQELPPGAIAYAGVGARRTVAASASASSAAQARRSLAW